jgi:hypothetical protein
LTFQLSIADELVRRLPTGKAVLVRSVGSDRDQAVADQYRQFLKAKGFQMGPGTRIGVMVPLPDYPITIRDAGDTVVVTIAPSAIP